MNPIQSRLMRATAVLYALLTGLVLYVNTVLARAHALRLSAVIAEISVGVGAPLAYVLALRFSGDRAVHRTWMRVCGAMPVHYAFSEDGFAIQSRSALSVVPWTEFDHSVVVGSYLLLCYPDGRYVTVPQRDLSAEQRARLDHITSTRVPRISTFKR